MLHIKKNIIKTIKNEIAAYKKEYYQDNKEVLAKYYKDNKEVIAEKKKEKVICECGSEIRKDCAARHRLTQKHQKYINSQWFNYGKKLIKKYIVLLL